jgi:hypothetical protein
MKTQTTDTSRTNTYTTPGDEDIAIHVLHHLTTHQMNGARIHFDKLRRRLGVDRVQLARVLGRLDKQGLVDCSKLRLTLQGFAIGMAVKSRDLPRLSKRAA